MLILSNYKIQIDYAHERTNECMWRKLLTRSTIELFDTNLVRSASAVDSVSAQSVSRKFIQNYTIKPETFSAADGVSIAGKRNRIKHVEISDCVDRIVLVRIQIGNSVPPEASG